MAIALDTTYRDLRASIARDKEQRIREHQANIAKTRRMSFALRTDGAEAQTQTLT